MDESDKETVVLLDKVQILNSMGDEDGDFATNFPQKKKKSGRQVRKRSEAETVPPDYCDEMKYNNLKHELSSRVT